MKRRLFLFAAPAIIAAPSLMRVSAKALPLNVTDFGAIPQGPFVVDTLVELKALRVRPQSVLVREDPAAGLYLWVPAPSEADADTLLTDTSGAKWARASLTLRL